MQTRNYRCGWRPDPRSPVCGASPAEHHIKAYTVGDHIPAYPLHAFVLRGEDEKK